MHNIDDPCEQGDSTLVREYLGSYLRDLYNDLVIRCILPAAVKAQLLDKVTFIEFSCLPSIIAETLFSIYDPNNDDMMTFEDFAECISTIFIGTFKQQCNLSFKM